MAEVSDPSGFGVTTSHDQPDMGAGTQTPDLCMNSTYSTTELSFSPSFLFSIRG